MYLDVVGFIIGIEGKNINSIRDMTGARIDVFHQDINNKFRQIELAGSCSDIAKASEKIYLIVNKYYYFDPEILREVEEGRSLYKQRDEEKERSSRKEHSDSHRVDVSFL